MIVALFLSEDRTPGTKPFTPMDLSAVSLVLLFGSLAAGTILGYLVRQNIAKKKLSTAEGQIAKMLSDAETRVKEVEFEAKNKAVAIVAEDQLSLAIGRDGQNVRLAAKLTGWKIDVRTPEGKEVKGSNGEQ